MEIIKACNFCKNKIIIHKFELRKCFLNFRQTLLKVIYLRG